MVLRVNALCSGRVDRRMKQPVVYILADKAYGTLYIGVTSKREKRLKKWNRAWKIRLIEEMNPEWKDLSSQAF